MSVTVSSCLTLKLACFYHRRTSSYLVYVVFKGQVCRCLTTEKATKDRTLVAIFLWIKESPKCLYQQEAVFRLTRRDIQEYNADWEHLFLEQGVVLSFPLRSIDFAPGHHRYILITQSRCPPSQHGFSKTNGASHNIC